MKVAIVVQRYGAEIVGGAEYHARKIAEHLVNDKQWDVDVYTTTCKSYLTWKNYYKSGSTKINGVRVKRFPCKISRNFKLFQCYNYLYRLFIFPLSKWLSLPFFKKILKKFEYLWFILQGPYCPELLNALKKNEPDYKKIFFFTYLYYPTVVGLPMFPKKSILIPTVHDEPMIYFPMIKKLFQNASTYLINNNFEQTLIEKVTPYKKRRYLIAGVGIDQPAIKKLTNKPDNTKYIIYLGRINKGKGVHNLINDFIQDHIHRKISGKQPIKLILAGSLDSDFVIPKHSYIQYRGFVSNEVKIELIRNSLCVINPSPCESLSLIVLESLSLGSPVLVNADCPVLTSYTNHVDTIFPYKGHLQFSQKLSYLESSHKKMEASLLDSQKWVLDAFSWKKILQTYEDVVAS